MAHELVHYVPLDCIRSQPPLVLSVCGTWSHGRNWTTAARDTTCPECLAFAAVAARLRHDPVNVLGDADPR